MQQHHAMQAAARAKGMLRGTVAQCRRLVARCGRLLNKRLQRVKLHSNGVDEYTRRSLYERQLCMCHRLCAVHKRITAHYSSGLTTILGQRKHCNCMVARQRACSSNKLEHIAHSPGGTIGGGLAASLSALPSSDHRLVTASGIRVGTAPSASAGCASAAPYSDARDPASPASVWLTAAPPSMLSTSPATSAVQCEALAC